jgi:hypothetical protein
LRSGRTGVSGLRPPRRCAPWRGRRKSAATPRFPTPSQAMWRRPPYGDLKTAGSRAFSAAPRASPPHLPAPFRLRLRMGASRCGPPTRRLPGPGALRLPHPTPSSALSPSAPVGRFQVRGGSRPQVGPASLASLGGLRPALGLADQGRPLLPLAAGLRGRGRGRNAAWEPESRRAPAGRAVGEPQLPASRVAPDPASVAPPWLHPAPPYRRFSLSLLPLTALSGVYFTFWRKVIHSSPMTWVIHEPYRNG